MTPEEWLAAARSHALAHGLQATVPVLESFADAMRVLRSAPWNDSASGRRSDPDAPRDESR